MEDTAFYENDIVCLTQNISPEELLMNTFPHGYIEEGHKIAIRKAQKCSIRMIVTQTSLNRVYLRPLEKKVEYSLTELYYNATDLISF